MLQKQTTLTLARLLALTLPLAVLTHAGPTYTITPIDLPLGSISAAVAGINNSGFVVGYASNQQGTYANFLYTPGLGTTTLFGFGRPAFSQIFSARVAAINDSGQILTRPGLLFNPGVGPADLAAAVTDAFPLEVPDFAGLNNKGQVSGQSLFVDFNGQSTAHGFRYTPGGAVESVATGNRRTFPTGPFKLNDAGYVVYSIGFPPGPNFNLFTPDGTTLLRPCGQGNGFPVAINNAGQVAGDWPLARICSFEGVTTELVDVNIYTSSSVHGLNDRSDVVGTVTPVGSNSRLPALIRSGEVIDINTLLPANSGWVLNTADAINNNGQIAGIGFLSGRMQAFVLTPINVAGPVPHIDSVLPSSAPPGTGRLTLTINGANFGPNPTVQFGSDNLIPTSRTPAKLTVAIPPIGSAKPHTASITVNGVSNVFAFPIAPPSEKIFTSAKYYPADHPVDIATADFNRDGKLDLVVGTTCPDQSPCSPGPLRILLGDGTGSFSAGPRLPATSSPTAIALGDFNEDGITDILSAGADSVLAVLTGDGTGNFRAGNFQGTPFRAVLSMVAGDFNADGHLDVAVAGTGTSPLLYLGDGTGSFAEGRALPAMEGASAMAIGDFNGDGKLDLVIASAFFPNLHTLLGNGSGDFSITSRRLTRISGSVAAGDWNGDGKLDLALTHDASLEILLGDGTGQFSAGGNVPTDFSVPPSLNPLAVAAGDINNDGKLDLPTAVGSQVANVIGAGDGSFTIAPGSSIGPAFEGTRLNRLALGDFNNDGRLDFALTSTVEGTGSDAGSISVWLQFAGPASAISYFAVPPCSPRACVPTLLGDSGIVAGTNFVVYPEAVPGQRPGYVDLRQATGSFFDPRSVNEAGVLVGSSTPPPSHAAAWIPGTSEQLDLDKVFGWTSGIASWINNSNQIVGNSDGDSPIINLVPGVVLKQVYEQTDSGTVLGEDSAGAVVYRPGSQPLHLPGVQLQRAFNSAGQVLITWPLLGRLYTPGLGFTNQPAQPGFSVISFNEVGQFVGSMQLTPSGTPVPAFYSDETGLIPIADLFPASLGWAVNRAVAINKRGQILLLATQDELTTALLLNPVGGLGPRLQSRSTATPLGCQSVVFNNAPTCPRPVMGRGPGPVLTPMK